MKWFLSFVFLINAGTLIIFALRIKYLEDKIIILDVERAAVVSELETGMRSRTGLANLWIKDTGFEVQVRSQYQ